jgi:hypothetical protein
MDGYTSGSSRTLAYDIQWQSGIAKASDSEHYDFDLKGVTGSLYRDGKKVADYAADAGTAVKATGLLTLSGNVEVTSADQKSKTLGTSVKCDQMLYNTSDTILKASGNVTILGKAFTLGPFRDIWCSNDLTEVTTPDQFVPVRHNQPSAPLP